MATKNFIALIDNYDSFTYNIYQMISQIIEDDPDEEVRIFRNDEISLKELVALNPDRLIISPGPGTPSDAGISVEAIRTFTGRIPILGVCLGHQCLAEAFGGEIVQAKNIVHGKVEPIDVDGKGVLRNLPNPCLFTRYHSLAVDPSSVPEELEVTARSADGEIMGLRHKTLPIEGVQFHPESIGSQFGDRLLANFLHWRREPLDQQGLLNRVISGADLTREEAAAFMDELTDGALEESYTAGLLTALSAKGVTAEEVAGCVSVLVEKRRPVNLEADGILDTCGTGGDGLHTFNISSFSALLAASCGATVAKHGNRSVSSKSGSTDFYSALGVSTNLDPDGVAASVKDEGFAYMAAPLFHGAMRYAGPVRKALGVKTIMNCLGPLANPAGADFQIIGVYEDALLPVLARAAKMLGVKRVMTVRSVDGLDEISPSAPTRIFTIDENGVESEELFDPGTLGITGFSVADLAGGDGAENARIARELLRGDGPPAVREAVCLNAGAALVVAGLASDIADGYVKAKAALADGRTADKVEALRKRTA
jgi:anthranilate synthase/phosphoribosyltransferase